jgi:hypothetical protein
MRTFKKSTKLKLIHLFNEIWKVGQYNYIKDPSTGGKTLAHIVIYGPDDKEYHVYDEDAKYIIRHSNNEDINDNDLYFNYGYYSIDLGRVKQYIIKNILFKHKHWNFIEKIPNKDSDILVLYDNGTIKNIKFQEEFQLQSIKIEKKIRDNDNNIISKIITKIYPKFWTYKNEKYLNT